MCHPAAPIEMKRRSMLCHSVRRVPPPKASSSHRISWSPQLYSSALGASARVTLASETCGAGAPTVVSLGTPKPTSKRKDSPWFQPYPGSHRLQREPTRADAPGRLAPARLFPAGGAVLLRERASTFFPPFLPAPPAGKRLGR